MNILLISPNTLTTPYPVYPIGLDYVVAAIAKHHQVRIADLNLISRTELAQLLADFAPEVIGLSCRNIDNTDAAAPLAFIDDYRQLVSWLRCHTRATLVCGGSGFTIMPALFFTAVGCDYGIIGEGERFGPFIEALAAGHDVADMDGVISARRPDSRPPPWDGTPARAFDVSSGHHAFYLANGGMLNVQTKRGCSFRCIYCPYPHIEGRHHRLQPPEHVAATALALQKAGARYLFITDSAFNSDVAHSLAVARAFKKAGLSIPWGGFFAPIRTDSDYFRTLKESGLKHVEFGTESLSDTMLGTYRKPFTSADVFASHRLAREAGLHVAHYFLLGGPGESEETVRTCLDGAESLDKTALFFFVGIRLYPNTALYDIAVAEGKLSPHVNLLQPVFYQADALEHGAIEALVKERAGDRINWVIGSGGDQVAATIKKLHQRNHCGPLWEYIAR
ncbi:lipid biosynthesis B12-binding/radical SAM protein [Desulfofustis glycolicus]|uniref:Radical SAM superfamily enzyme YgiQ, UPF0313 family n=1 Tax=Desulfofustis glycolicus DSM 9705 TaxID=1121409 RepID=A0A1M5UN02_9BACT|nr:lipid biosynthesis B12-binding/radical SAM protein [Desulfofustis glycolicus]MCB2217401.1 radical SAM protein [Desulfobulbaceae bacterium]SHH64327.1 Radical SAM superfamily enzyme YgiQ, UPF0313 family [Desulfofustis glycolicus DSM 9705]